jgi:hypothetical protein
LPARIAFAKKAAPAVHVMFMAIPVDFQLWPIP